MERKSCFRWNKEKTYILSPVVNNHTWSGVFVFLNTHILYRSFSICTESHIQFSLCLDIDECIEDDSVDCGEHAECNNTVGSYTCDCLNGYEKNKNGQCEGNYHSPISNLCVLWNKYG